MDGECDVTGNFISAEEADLKIIIPVTEESSGRTSSPSPHPLYDNIDYISGIDEKKYNLFLKQMTMWEESEYGDDCITAVLNYIKGKTLIDDLSKSGLIKFDPNGNVVNKKDLVAWRVYGRKCKKENIYEDIELMNKYNQFYMQVKGISKKEICYITGEEDFVASQHLKGVVSLNGNAKIVSANDNTNFTYRGRFIESKEALSVGYTASQKSHNALKWLAANQKVVLGDRVLICWNPEGKKIPRPDSPLIRKSKEEIYKPSDYKEKLRSVLFSYKKSMGEFDEAVIVTFDAATTGRLTVSYYNEMKCSDFLERIEYWDDTCCWYDNNYGTYSPGLYDIVDVAFGFQRGNEDISRIETDPKVVSQHLQRLIKCRIDKTNIPRDILNAIISKTANLQIYNAHNRRKALFTACAVIRKYYIDSRKEIWEMALDKDKKDRSYQFGRLLAVFEKIERDVYSVSGEKRETNAIRMQSVYVKRPAYASKILLEQLKNSYYPKLTVGTRTYYDKLIGQIMSIISEFGDDNFNKPLSETYLLGYYLQRNDLYTKKEETEDGKDE